MSEPIHPPRSILAVADEVIEQVRLDERMSDALDAYGATLEPRPDNVNVRWLSRKRGYEVTLRFDAAILDTPSRSTRKDTHE